MGRNRLLLLAGLLGLCLLSLCRPGAYANVVELRSQLEEQVAHYSAMPLEQAMAELNARTENGTMVTMEYSQIYRQVAYLSGFDQYIAGILDRAENMSTVSIFAGSPYSQANIRKTAADYSRLKDLPLTIGNDVPAQRVMDSTLSDWLLGAYMLAVTYAFLAERKRGLWNMVSASPRGRGRLALWRLSAIGAAACIAAPAFTLLELVYAYTVHGGWQELGRIVQSASLFQNLTVPMTFWQLWLLYILLRILSAFVAGCVAWFLLELVGDRRLTAAVWAGAAVGEYWLAKLPEASPFRQINVLTYLQPRRLLMNYRNLNLFGRPVSQPVYLALGALVFLLLMLGMIAWIYRSRKPVEGYRWLDRIAGWLRRRMAPLGRNTSLVGHELYKNLATGRGWLLLAGALLVAGVLSGAAQSSGGGDVELFLESYYRQSQGPVTGETEAYLAQRQERLAALFARRDQVLAQYQTGELDDAEFQGMMLTFSSLDAQAEALERYAQHLARLRAQPGSYVLPHWVYGDLLRMDSPQTNSLLLLAAVTVLLLFFAQAGVERRTGMGQVQRSTVRGRQVLRLRRHGAAWLLTGLFSAAVWLIQLLRLRSSYGGLPWLEAPVRCLFYFSQLPGGISILGYWLLLVAGRTLGLCLFSSLVLGITEMGVIHGNQR